MSRTVDRSARDTAAGRLAALLLHTPRRVVPDGQLRRLVWGRADVPPLGSLSVLMADVAQQLAGSGAGQVHRVPDVGWILLPDDTRPVADRSPAAGYGTSLERPPRPALRGSLP